MQIIFGKENADELRQKYTVLALEEITQGEGRDPIPTYCVVSADMLPLTELPLLSKWVTLHEEFLHGYHTEQYEYCKECIGHLTGKFGGELDTFYEEILKRIIDK